MGPTYRNLTTLFSVCTIILWCLINYLLICDPDLDGVDQQQAPNGNGAEDNEGVAQKTRDELTAGEWLKGKLLESASTVNPSCRSEGDGGEPFAVLAAVGDLHLNLGGTSYPDVVAMLNGVTTVADGTDMIMSDLGSQLSLADKGLPEVLRDLGRLGFGLLSLGNLPSRLYSDAELHSTVKMMETAQIYWVGVGQGTNFVNERVLTINGQKVGFLAFCGIYGQCAETRERPLVPTRYDTKLAASAIEKLKSHGVAAIVVLVYWGQEHSYFPDESELVIARQLAEQGVTLVIGYHPQLVQDHAYFGKTLVLFSPGNLLTSNEESDFCWNKNLKGVWEYSDSNPACQSIHPRMHKSVQSREQITRVYKVGLSRSGVAVATYADVPLAIGDAPPYVRKPVFEESYRWTEVCSSLDTNCLSCEPL